MASRRDFIIKRFFLSVFSLWVVATILFLLFRLAPGDPARVFITPEMDAEAIANIRSRYGLDEPLYVQYYKYLFNLLQGDFGVSFSYSRPASAIIFERGLNTLVLMIPALVSSFIIGPVFGAYLAWNRGSSLDATGISALLISRGAPAFWVGMLVLMLFSFRLGWFPSGGMVDPTFTYDGIFEKYFNRSFLIHLILPFFVVTFYWTGPPALLMRSNMIDKIGTDYIDLNFSKGFSDRRILYKHAARNSLLPVVHYMAVATGFAFGGSVIIETVFSWPGVGKLMFDSVLANDYPVAQGSFIIIAAMVISLNFIVDILSVYIDPRAVGGGGE